jgi:hypothetical protein
MNLKTTYILFGLLVVVLAAFAAFQIWGDRGPKGGAGDALFADFSRAKDPVKADELDSVRVERTADGKKEALLFVRGKDGWQMKEPYALRVDTYQVDNLARQVSGAQREKSEMSSNLAEYGLEDPQAVVTLAKGDQEWKLNVGKQSAGAAGVVYVSNAAKPKEPAAVRKASLDSVFKKVNDFRSKDLLATTSFNASAIALDAKGTTLSLEKSGEGRWRFVKPSYGPANFEGDPPPPGNPPVVEKKVNGVRDLIDDAGGLRVEANDDFIADGVGDADLAAKYGLEKDKPETLRVEVKTTPAKGDAKTEVLLIGKKAPKAVEEKKDDKKDTKKDEKKPEAPPEYYYVRLESENSVERVPAAKVKPLLDVIADPSALRSHALVSVGGSSKIDAIDVQAGSSTVKLRQVDGKWTLYHGGARATDDSTVRALVGDITDKSVWRKFVDKEDGLEFDKPQAVVSVWIDGVKKEEKKEEKKDEEKKEGDKPEEKKEEKKDKEPALTSDKPAVKLTFGKRDRDNNLVYVRRESGDDKSIVAVSASVLDNVTAGPLAYLDRKLPSFGDAFSAFKDVTRLTLVRGGQTWEVAKEKAGDKEVWKVVQPQALAGRTANEVSVGNVLRDLANLRAEKIVAEKPSETDLDQLYGLKKPETIATVTVKKEKEDKPEDWVYTFGKQSDTKMGVYAKQNKNDLVFLVPKATADHLAAADLRDLTVFNFDVSKVKGAKITVWSSEQNKPVELGFERKGDKDWVKTSGFIDTPDGAKLDNLISGLSHLQASKFVTPKQNVDTGLDVDKKALKVEITVGDETLDLLVGNEDPDSKGMLFASSNKQKGDVFLVPELMFKEAKASPAYFRK